MRRIDKGAEPRCLADLRATPGADWSSVHGTQKQEMRESAHAEQHGLCAYCMSRLPSPPADVSMKIEHFAARNAKPELVFTWLNLLGVCCGDVGVPEGSGERRARFHCDTFRGHLPLAEQQLDLHPARPERDVGRLFSYTRTGEMRPARDLPEPVRVSAEEMIERLNLNIARLKRNRAEIRERLETLLRTKPPKPGQLRQWLEVASTPDEHGLLKEYCQVAILYLEKKLRQLPWPRSP